MNKIAVFEFQAREVRTVTDEYGEPQFVAKDVCDILGIEKYRDAIATLDEDERVSILVDTPGGKQNMTAVNESGLYALIFKSRKPEAKAFRKWVTSEVLPALRKTGTYTNPAHPANAGRKGPHKWGAGELSTAALASEFRAFRSFALAAGLKGNPATISADTAMRRIYGVSPLGVMQIELQSEQQSLLFTPTQIAQNVGLKNAREANQVLGRLGLQTKLPSGEWEPTEQGRQCSVLLDTGKRHSNGAMIKQLKWTEEALALVVRVKAAAEEGNDAA